MSQNAPAPHNRCVSLFEIEIRLVCDKLLAKNIQSEQKKQLASVHLSFIGTCFCSKTEQEAMEINESKLLAFSLMLALGIIFFLLEYFDRRALAKENAKQSFHQKSLSWRMYMIIALGVYGAIRLVWELM